MKKHYNLYIKGKVQGVWYRASTRNKAQELGLKGFVRNESDGSVYVEVEGEEELLDQFVAWCRQGPPQAIVKEVEKQEEALRHFEKFEIISK